jgi:hypothetical protein
MEKGEYLPQKEKRCRMESKEFDELTLEEVLNMGCHEETAYDMDEDDGFEEFQNLEGGNDAGEG